MPPGKIHFSCDALFVPLIRLLHEKTTALRFESFWTSFMLFLQLRWNVQLSSSSYFSAQWYFYARNTRSNKSSIAWKLHYLWYIFKLYIHTYIHTYIGKYLNYFRAFSVPFLANECSFKRIIAIFLLSSIYDLALR